MNFVSPIDEELSLRLASPWHAEEVFKLVESNRAHLDPWMPWVGDTQTPEDVRRWAEEACAKFGRKTDLQVNILEHGVMVGTVGMHELDNPSGSAEIGYWLAAEAQGRGIITRACHFLIGQAFREFGLHRVHLWTDARNTRSRAVAERLGMRLEGHLKQNLKTHHHNYRDSVLYAVLKDEWEGGTES